MRFLRIIVLACVMVLLLSPIKSNAQSPFIDLKENDKSYESVKFLYDYGVVDNKLSAFYGITGTATRAQVITMIGKILGLDGTQRETSFKDVPESHYASGYIQAAVELGIVTGYSKDTFSPQGELTRGHLAVFLERAFGEHFLKGDINFKDVSKESSSYLAITKLAHSKITTGYSDGTFKPNNTLTREHLTVFIERTIKHLLSQNINIPMSNPVGNNDLDTSINNSSESISVNDQITLTNYLKENYSSLETEIYTVKFDFSVSENDNLSIPYDYFINLNFDNSKFESAMNTHLSSIKYAASSKEDVATARNQLKTFIEKMALDVMNKMPDKKFLGQDKQTGYRYRYIKEGYYRITNYSWTNYEPISMKTIWPGDRPEDYSIVMSALKNPSDPKVIQYSKDEMNRTYYTSEYNRLKYNDVKLSSFRWTPFLDDAHFNY